MEIMTYFNPISGPRVAYRKKQKKNTNNSSQMSHSEKMRMNITFKIHTDWTIEEAIWMLNGSLYTSNGSSILVQYTVADYMNYADNIKKAKNKLGDGVVNVYIKEFDCYYKVDISSHWHNDKCYIYQLMHMCQSHYVYYLLVKKYKRAMCILNAMIAIRNYSHNVTFKEYEYYIRATHGYFLQILVKERNFMLKVMNDPTIKFDINIKLYAEYKALSDAMSG